MGWYEALPRFGTFPLAKVIEPAICHASRGFLVAPYQQERVSEAAAELARGPEIAKNCTARRHADLAPDPLGHRRLCRDATINRAQGAGHVTMQSAWRRKRAVSMQTAGNPSVVCVKFCKMAWHCGDVGVSAAQLPCLAE
ncbi:gamma-glutamyltransferase family protein, partial [Mesorhizobium sp. M0859]